MKVRTMATPTAGDPNQRRAAGTKGFVTCLIGMMGLFLVVMLVFLGFVFWAN